MSDSKKRLLTDTGSPDVRGGMGIFYCAGATSLVLLAALLLFGLLIARGAAPFWPRTLVEWQLDDGRVLLVHELEVIDGEMRARMGNRDLNPGREDHLRAAPEEILKRSVPEDAVRIERSEHGPFHGYFAGGSEAAATREDGTHLLMPDRETELILEEGAVLRWSYVNQQSFLSRVNSWLGGTWRFLVEGPREANTEGGIFPALIGTCLLVLLMSIMVVPFGVLAAVYLNEYAKDTLFVKLVRVAVNNLAGVPSIVYGVFGLGFFVYGVGGSIDQLFYSDKLPAPTFGSSGLLWASLTMSLLTVPVVIVATEEALRAVPRERRDAALALGATRWESLKTVILPGAKPGILTGLILAVSRAAGEVAPLMLTGAVAFAEELPVDGEFPFVHLERKFMHLGHHIFSVGFQSPDVEAVVPIVYATSAMLIALVAILNLAAVRIRTRVRRQLSGV